MMSTIKLIIFDLDGTLIDSLDDLTQAVNNMRSAFGLDPIDRNAVRGMVGQGARNLVERALPKAGQAEVEQGLSLFLAYNEEHVADRTVPYPGVRETLELLSSRGFTSVVVSNKNQLLCRKVLEQLHLDGIFKGIYGADSLPARKPSPEPLRHVMRVCGYSADETIMVGDSINDVAAGVAAGVLTIGCNYGYGEPTELDGAAIRIREFAELLALPLFAAELPVRD
ncbi:HAD family hydrolase [Geobacter argillaceus]|uniref:phosphoglycolate phosphatase n=1 Tax=Geobacter argillaceus TaxID=345631 RepID=A0A562VIX5_9BACT|nr:HAD-IA family hydrolase [Geobacter argillaceus]TWJ17744.1 phosphoglycolate phosphatase [Geobacter argillaceus]